MVAMKATTTEVTLSLRYLRRAAGLTQRELARRLGVNRVTILRWETGETKPSYVHVETLARALGVHEKVVLTALRAVAA